MAFYRLTSPAWVHGTYYAAEPRSPIVIELPDHVQPSRKWTRCEGPATADSPPAIPADALTLAQFRAKEVGGADFQNLKKQNEELKARLAALEGGSSDKPAGSGQATSSAGPLLGGGADSGAKSGGKATAR